MNLRKKVDVVALAEKHGATAREIEFQIANRVIDYSLERKELLGKPLQPDSANRLKIRMLVDWSSLEVFAAGGVFSYSQQFAFQTGRPKIFHAPNLDLHRTANCRQAIRQEFLESDIGTVNDPYQSLLGKIARRIRKRFTPEETRVSFV